MKHLILALPLLLVACSEDVNNRERFVQACGDTTECHCGAYYLDEHLTDRQFTKAMDDFNALEKKGVSPQQKMKAFFSGDVGGQAFTDAMIEADRYCRGL